MRKTRERKPASASEKTFTFFAYILMTMLAFICILPCMHVISKAISGGEKVTTGQVFFWPKSIQFDTVKYILQKTEFFNCLKNTLIVTILGTFISMFTTITTAYPLSQPQMPGRKFFVLLYVFSMVFFGGIVPAYMVVNTLGILDTYWAIILPFAIIQFNMFVTKSYFEGIPDSMLDAAHIDGASDVQTLVMIVLPTSKPVIATVSLLYAVNYWNNYFHAMMYTSSSSMKTLQVYLYDIINNGQAFLESLYSGSLGTHLGSSMANITTDGMVSAAVTLSIIPIVLLYPFVQRYVVQGITLGSVKG